MDMMRTRHPRRGIVAAHPKRGLRHRRIGATTLVLLGIAGGLLAQPPDTPTRGSQPAVTFRLDVDYVEVDAVVTDANGEFVRDLSIEDFRIVEDGEPQQVDIFSLVDLPVSTPAPTTSPGPAIEPDVQSNAQPFDGRIYVLVLDDYHTVPLRTSRVIAAARLFIEEHLGPDDYAALIHTSGRPDASQGFTRNTRLLLEAASKFIGRKTQISSMAPLPVSNGRFEEFARNAVDPSDFERGFEARASLSAIEEATGLLAGIRGRRKAVVMLSEGIDYNVFDLFNTRHSGVIHDAMRRVVAAATQSNTSIYTVDPRGLTGLRTDVELYEIPDDTLLSLGGPLDRLFLSQHSLRVLAEDTGGFATFDSNAFGDAFDRIVRANSAYYLLGYYPTNTERDGRFREIQVTVVGRPGLEIRARKGYVAGRGDPDSTGSSAAVPGTSTELQEALNNPIPLSGLSMRVSAIPFLGADSATSMAIVVEVDGAGLRFDQRDDRFVDDLELSLFAFDRGGRVHGGDLQTAEMSLRPETHAMVAANGIRLISRVELPPGRYQLRVGLRQSNGGALGSVNYDLEVPDFAADQITMSGIALTSSEAAETPTAKPDEDLASALPGPVTTARSFSSDATLALFVEVYDTQPTPTHRIDITTTLRAPDGVVEFRTTEDRSTEELEGARGGFGHRALIPLGDLAPGSYVLRTEARSRLSSEVAAVREMQIQIQ